MPTQVLPVRELALPAALAGDRRAVWLDGGTADSWGDGSGLYAAGPAAVLEVFAQGVAREIIAGKTSWIQGDPFDLWQSFLDHAPQRIPEPSAGAVVSVFAYDLKHHVERLTRRHPWPRSPLLYAALYDRTCRIDYRNGTATVGAPNAAALREWLAGLMRPRMADSGRPTGIASTPHPALARGAYLAMVDRALEYIAAGDIYQVNLAQSFVWPYRRVDARALFPVLRAGGAMPYSAYVDGGDWQIASASPECFLTIAGDDIATYPIKGTRRRGAGIAGPPLAADPKEHAEHVMIVDLERNDLGRICETGSVRVEEMARQRSFPFLDHLVSAVRGRIRAGVSPADILRAMFPGGSITGAPKIRAMQIIEEIEPQARGVYTGAIGWTDLHGGSRFSLAIRTGVFEDGVLSYHAGGGIVADSDPQREYDETLLKSEGFMRAVAQLESGELESAAASAPAPPGGVDRCAASST